MGQTVDKRDSLTWITLELTYLGETKVEEGTLDPTLRNDLKVGPDFPIFIPATTYHKHEKAITIHLMEGYAFVGSGLSDVLYLALEKKPYIEQVMSTEAGPNRIRTLSTIPNSYIVKLRRQLRELVVSDISLNCTVKVTDGTYRALEGKVLGMRGDHAFVLIQLRSIEIIATIPLGFLEVL